MKNIKNILIGIAVVVVLLIGGLAIKSFIPVASEVKPQDALAAQVQNDVFAFTSGASFGTHPRLMNWVPLTMGPGQNQAAWQNTTGAPAIIPGELIQFVIVPSNATTSALYNIASSTMVVLAGSSTSAVVSNGTFSGGTYTPGFYDALIDQEVIATGTQQNTVFDNITNSKLSGTNEQGEVSVPNGAWAVFALENPYATPGTCTGALCENATSTNRGYNAVIDFPYFQ